MGLFIFENKFEHVTSNTQFRLAQITVALFTYTLYYKFVTWVNHHTNVLLLVEMMASNMKKLYWEFHNDIVNSFGVMGKVSATFQPYNHFMMSHFKVSFVLYTVIPSK